MEPADGNGIRLKIGDERGGGKLRKLWRRFRIARDTGRRR